MFAAQDLLSVQPLVAKMESSLADAVTVALRSSGYQQLHALSVRVDGHDVILHGRLPSYYLKQIAHHIVSAVPGVHVILDAIDVVT